MKGELIVGLFGVMPAVDSEGWGMTNLAVDVVAC